MKPSALQRSKAAWSPTLVATSIAPCILGTRSMRGRSSAETAATSTRTIEHSAHQLLDVVDQLRLVLVQSDGVAGAGELLEDRQEVLAGAVGLDLEHGAVGADRRRADLDQEVARDRHPRGMAAGQGLQPDVAERLDQQGGGGLGVHGRIAEVDGAAEAQLVAHDDVARVRDRMANDRDFLAAGMRGGGHGECSQLRTSANADASGLRLRFTKADPDRGVPCRSR